MLLRVGIDATAGSWNAPAKVSSRHFVYVPIPESSESSHPGLERTYKDVEPVLKAFGTPLPVNLKRQTMHLDPDFDHLTFGDQGSRGTRIRKLAPGDFIAFYASLRPDQVLPTSDPLLYALVGFYIVDSVIAAAEVPEKLWHTNAHTRRKVVPGDDDVIVRARPGKSGRLERFIPIGEYRNKSYRVTNALLDAWGGLTVKDGYLQRSAVPPFFIKPKQFLEWFEAQGAQLKESNW